MLRKQFAQTSELYLAESRIYPQKDNSIGIRQRRASQRASGGKHDLLSRQMVRGKGDGSPYVF
jgi:hypothetical protein